MWEQIKGLKSFSLNTVTSQGLGFFSPPDELRPDKRLYRPEGAHTGLEVLAGNEPSRSATSFCYQNREPAPFICCYRGNRHQLTQTGTELIQLYPTSHHNQVTRSAQQSQSPDCFTNSVYTSTVLLKYFTLSALSWAEEIIFLVGLFFFMSSGNWSLLIHLPLCPRTPWC